MIGVMILIVDDTKTMDLEEMDLKFLTGPWEFEIPFAVVDVLAVFNLLLGRPWIHTVSTIPSNLH